MKKIIIIIGLLFFGCSKSDSSSDSSIVGYWHLVETYDEKGNLIVLDDCNKKYLGVYFYSDGSFNGTNGNIINNVCSRGTFSKGSYTISNNQITTVRMPGDGTLTYKSNILELTSTRLVLEQYYYNFTSKSTPSTQIIDEKKYKSVYEKATY